MYDFTYGLELFNEEKTKILNKFKMKYIKTDYSDQSIMWNHFIFKPICVAFCKIEKIQLPKKKSLLFYLERQDKMYRIKFEEALDYVNKLEPWEEIDAYIFTDDLDWVIAITHEDNLSLIIGLDL